MIFARGRCLALTQGFALTLPSWPMDRRAMAVRASCRWGWRAIARRRARVVTASTACAATRRVKANARPATETLPAHAPWSRVSPMELAPRAPERASAPRPATGPLRQRVRCRQGLRVRVVATTSARRARPVRRVQGIVALARSRVRRARPPRRVRKGPRASGARATGRSVALHPRVQRAWTLRDSRARPCRPT